MSFILCLRAVIKHNPSLVREGLQKGKEVIDMADAVMGYCVKCKEKREMQDAEEVTMKNGRKAMKGKCGVCGTGMYKILGKA